MAALERLVSPKVPATGNSSLLHALAGNSDLRAVMLQLVRDGSLLAALHGTAQETGTISVQNGSQNGSLAQKAVIGQGRDVEVSRSYQPTY
jgi:hypothetical protein